MTKKFEFLPSYAPIFYDQKTYWIISGGRASGKSTNIAAYFIMTLMGNEYARLVIARYTTKALTNSIYRDILDLISQWGIESYLDIKGDEILNKSNGNMIITHAMKLAEGTMSAKGKGLARVTHLLIDEATELNSEEEYLKLIDSFRQKDAERKIFLLFNPTSKSHWIFKRFYLPDGKPNPKWKKNHGFLHTTYIDNSENLDPSKIEEWEDLKDIDPDYYSHHIQGNWKDVGEGQVFNNWKFEDFRPDSDSEIVYGLDFGFSKDPSALVKVYKRANRIWVEELIYDQGLTAEDLADRMTSLGIPKNALIYADAARPDMIETIRRKGFSSIRKSSKGPGSIESGIDRVKSYEVFCNPTSSNLIEEYYNYVYKSGADKPIDSWNHCFVGDTLITTDKGLMRIDQIKRGDKVLTRAGFKTVLKAFDNGVKEVVTYTIFDGIRYVRITSTPDHKIWQNNNWFPISQLQQGSEIYLLNGSTEKTTDSIQNTRTGLMEAKECTLQSGNSIMVKSLKDTTSIIGTTTSLITELKILNWSTVLRILPTIPQKDLKKILYSLRNSKRLGKSQLNKKWILGDNQRRAKNSTKESEHLLSKIKDTMTMSVKNVATYSSQEYLKRLDWQGPSINSIQNIAISTVDNVQVTSAGKQRVYDLHVEDHHEYFANGLLVHNCMDSLRYAVAELKNSTGKYAVMGRKKSYGDSY